MNLEELQRSLDETIVEMREKSAAADTLDEKDDATDEERTAAHAEFVELRDKVESLKADVDQREARQRARDQHKPSEATPEERARVAVGEEERIFRPDQRGKDNEGFFHTLALAKGGDAQARDLLMRNNEQAADAATRRGDMERAGDLTTATHMGEFVPPDWTNELYAPFLRAGRPFADQCQNVGVPVTTSWNLPRITTGATTAAQTEGSTVSNTDNVSDSITAALTTIAGSTLASYQLVELGQPGMDQIIYQDLLGSYNQQVDITLLNGSATNAKGALQLASTNAVTVTISTPTGALLWPYIFQGKSLIEKNTFSEVDFSVWHPSTWNWYLSQLDSSNRPLALSQEGSAFNNMALYAPKGFQGLAGNIGGIPVIVDANVPVNIGAGTNQAQILLVNRGALLKKETGPRFKAVDQLGALSLMWNFVLFGYLQQMFGRYPKKISVLSGTGLIVQSGF